MGDLTGCSIKTMMPTTHHHPLMKLSIKLMRVLIIVHSTLSTWCTIHYTGLSPSWSYTIFQILSQMSFCWKSHIYAALKHFPSPFLTLYFHSLHDTAQRLHFMASEYVQCHRLPSTLAHAICRCAWECCKHQFSGKAGWRREGNTNLHTWEPLKLINASCDQPKTSNTHYRPDLPKCYEGHQIVYSGRE